MSTLEDLLKIIKKNDKRADLDLVRLAYDFAEEAHLGQFRKSGEPYINHPLQTAIILAELKLDLPAIIAGLLHDVPEDTHYNLVDVEKNFGEDVAKLVVGVSKLGKIKYRGIKKYAENLRKMFVAMAEDIRIIIIKMADRLHNLKTLDALPSEKQKRIAQETLEIYAPIANRLGIGYLKGELEDLAFPYVYPDDYAWVKKIAIPCYEERMKYIQKVIKVIQKEIANEKIKIISIHGRAKRLYSLYQKLFRPQYNKDITKIYDLIAIRITVPTVADCYATLGVIHKLWKPLIGRIKDYISQPKPNGYQSLHTTVFCLDGKIAEFQIRTLKMHEQAEFGIAAYWHYKETKKFLWPLGGKGYTPPQKVKWIQELIQWQKEIADSQTFLKSLKLDSLQNRIFVFTPKGDVIDLPEEATPVDFAYHIHTEIGDKCVGAKVNGQMTSLDTKLKNGDVCEITTDKSRKGPSLDWLKFVKTGIAKSKIKERAKKKY